jgi:Cu-Zn family superoxide dismutase
MKFTAILSSLALMLSFSGLSVAEESHSGHDHEAHSGDAHAAPALTKLVCHLQATAGNKAAGTVTFTQMEGGKVKVTAEVAGLTPNSKHAIHIHEFGDIGMADGTGTGGHYNPEGHDHGLPGSEMRHAGDFGNLEANAEGVATFELIVDNLTLNGEKNPILGRGMIVHAGADDGGQPTGNAGARITQGVIGVAKGE